MGNWRSCPKRITRVSSLETLTRARGFKRMREKASRFHRTVASSAAPPFTYSQAISEIFAFASGSKSVTHTASVLGVPRLLALVAFAPPAIMPTPARVPAETNASRRESGIHVLRGIDLRRVCSAGACQPAKNHIHQAEHNRSYESCTEAIHAKAFDDGGR